jgi:hypothetical protein
MRCPCGCPVSREMKILGKDIYAYMSFPNRPIKMREMPLQAVLAKPHLAVVTWGYKCVFSMCPISASKPTFPDTRT